MPVGDVTPRGLGFLLAVAHRARQCNWEAALNGMALSAPQAALLRLVVAHPGQGIRWQARELQTDPTNVQRIAGTLIAAGLCERRRDPEDARRRPLYPTEAGVQRAAVVARAAQRAERQLAAALGPRRYRLLTASLNALIVHDRRAFEAAEAEARP